ncbi:hypothetical protein [Streptococcus oralis]|uniref:hypothetical protein n=1 Tax=Streptococcus oralis TaxID=1303 RepID=UPI0020010763|nr:hypothetical protein [Streptococcus oralis]
MKLWEYVDKNVRLILEDGTSIKGRVVDWFDGYDLDGPDEIDNDEQDEITILIANPSPDEATEISLFESEIVSIKTIS